jgi:hypothetical protein
MQLVADGKKEQGRALWNLELPKRVHHRLHSLRIRASPYGAMELGGPTMLAGA